MLNKLLYLMMILSLVSVDLKSETVRDITPLTSNVEIWSSSKDDYCSKYSQILWMYGKRSGEFVNNSKNMVLWERPVERLKLVESKGRVRSLKMTLYDKKISSKLSSVEFSSLVKSWSEMVSKKLKSDGLEMPVISMKRIKRSRIVWVSQSSVIVLTADKGITPDQLELTCYERKSGMFRLKLTRRRMAKIRKDAEKRRKLGDEKIARDSGDGRAAREVKKEIRTKIKEITARKAPAGVSKGVQDAVNLLNVYRYLSKVPYDVVADVGMNTASFDAASICKKNGTLSHDFGHSTNKCNLAMNSASLTMENSVTQYMEDSGANNRERRGHRRWCLNHRMGKTGFGINGAYSAMYSLDHSAKGISKSYSYPGHGFYPKSYLHGNGWSYHSVDGAVPQDSTVQVWKLKRFQEKTPKWSSEPEGRKLPTAFKHILRDTVVFEPESSPITKKGTYLVRIKGSGFKEQYLVHLY